VQPGTLVELAWSVIGGAGAGIAVVAWLGKRLIAHMLEIEQRKLEAKLRLQADLELERVREVSAIAKSEHEIMLSRLQDRRARVIGALYTKLVMAKQRTQVYVMYTPPQPQVKIQMQEKAWDAIEEATTFFAKHRVWLPKDSSNAVENFTQRLLALHYQRTVYDPNQRGSAEFEQERDRSLREAWNAIQEILPAALESLTDELRGLLDPRLKQDDARHASDPAPAHLIE
jgi:hypothetical protein